MNITTEINDSNIEESKFIQSNAYADYWFIGADVSASIEIEGDTHNIGFQTGHDFDYGDYSMPSNTLSIYADASSDLIASIDSRFDELEDQDAVDEINDDAGTSYSAEEMQAIYQAITELRVDAQAIIAAAQQEAEEECKEDAKHYVLVQPREFEHVNNDEWQKVQSGYEELESFNTEEEAGFFIEEKSTNENDIDLVRHLTSEDARARFPEEF